MLLAKIAETKNQFEKLNEDYSSIQEKQAVLTPVSESENNHINITQYLKTPRPPQQSTSTPIKNNQAHTARNYDRADRGVTNLRATTEKKA